MTLRGIATIDWQPEADEIAVWVTSRMGSADAAANVNAVVLSLSDPETREKVRSLTRCSVVLLTSGSALDAFQHEGDPLTADDLDSLVDEIANFQGRISAAVASYKAATRNRNLTEPSFPKPPILVETHDTASGRAFSLANYVGAVWTTWLKTDKERRERTVQPRTGATPWIMPADMSDQTSPMFPPDFSARLAVQPVV